MDGSSANKAAIDVINRARIALKLRPLEIRQCKYLNNILEQDHRAIKRITRPMLGFKSFVSATATLCGIELVHMLRKGQLRPKYAGLSLAEQFDTLAA